jgi:hypothetical protein
MEDQVTKRYFIYNQKTNFVAWRFYYWDDMNKRDGKVISFQSPGIIEKAYSKETIGLIFSPSSLI